MRWVNGEDDARDRLARHGPASVALAEKAEAVLDVVAYHEPLCEWTGCHGCQLRQALQAWADAQQEPGWAALVLGT